MGIALACQTLIWSLAAYTQMRYAEDASIAAAQSAMDAKPVIVKQETAPPHNGRILPPPSPGTSADAENPKYAKSDSQPAALSDYDRHFNALFDFVGGAGRIAMVVLVAAMGLGVMLGASSAVTGAERSTLAFVWAVVVALLVLPLGGLLHLPWEEGALTTYAHMTEWVGQIEEKRAASLAGETPADNAPSTMVFHARFLLLPMACIVGLVLIGLRFTIALEAAVVRRESMKLDPALEREAANISPTSLHGTRGASIISRTIAPTEEPEPVVASKDSDDAPPRRLI